MAIKMKKGGDWVDIKTTTEVDPELKKSFYPAEAKAVGDRFQEMEEENLIKHQQYTEIFQEVNQKVEDLDNQANLLQRGFLHMKGESFDVLWEYPDKEKYFSEKDVFSGEYYTMEIEFPDLGNSEKYPWLIIVSANASVTIPNHTLTTHLSYIETQPRLKETEEGELVPDNKLPREVLLFSREIKLDADKKTIIFGNNQVCYLKSDKDDGVLNGFNKPYAILGVRDLNYSDYGLEYLLTQSY